MLANREECGDPGSSVYLIARSNELSPVLSMIQCLSLLRRITYLWYHKYDTIDGNKMVDWMIVEVMILDLMIENLDMIVEAFVWISSYRQGFLFPGPLDLVYPQC